VRRKDLCRSVRIIYILKKLPDVSRPGLVEAGRYTEYGSYSIGLLYGGAVVVFRTS
jgi:hypothetical protein